MKIEQNKYLIILLVYVLSNGLMLLNYGAFWDDWGIYNMPNEVIKLVFIDGGYYYTGIYHIHAFLQSTYNPSLVYHTLIFFLGLGTIFLSLNILSKIKTYFNNEAVFVIALIMASIPFNAAKTTMICIPYSLWTFLFIAAFSLFQKSIIENKSYLRVLSLILFLYSFNLWSLLCLYLFIIPVYLYHKNHKLNFDAVTVLLKKTPDFLALPFFYYFVIKANFLQAAEGGTHAKSHYYDITLSKLLMLPRNLIKAITESSVGLLHQCTLTLSSSILTLVFWILISFILFKLFKKINLNLTLNTKRFFVIGSVLSILAIIPYLLGGKVPEFNGYNTRLQNLLPFGISILICAIIVSLFNNKSHKLILAMVIGGFVSTSALMQLTLITDWLKQESIMQNMQLINWNQVNNNILIEDHSTAYSFFKTHYRDYEWAGLYKKATGKQNKALIDGNFIEASDRTDPEKVFEGFNTISSNELHMLNMRDYKYTEGFSKISIETTGDCFNVVPVIRLLYKYSFNYPAFNSEIKKYTFIKLNK